MSGLHDNPGMYPKLPARPLDAETLETFAPPEDEFREAWEFLLSHDLTEEEGSAFWHGVEIQRMSTRRVLGVDR